MNKEELLNFITQNDINEYSKEFFDATDTIGHKKWFDDVSVESFEKWDEGKFLDNYINKYNITDEISAEKARQNVINENKIRYDEEIKKKIAQGQQEANEKRKQQYEQELKGHEDEYLKESKRIEDKYNTSMDPIEKRRAELKKVEPVPTDIKDSVIPKAKSPVENKPLQETIEKKTKKVLQDKTLKDSIKEAAEKTVKESAEEVTTGAVVKNIKTAGKTIIKNVSNATDAAAKWATNTEWGAYGLIGAAAFIGVASVLDTVNHSGEERQSNKQKRIQEKRLKERSEKELEDRWTGLAYPPSNVGLVQDMFQNRTGHSNTWGGNRY